LLFLFFYLKLNKQKNRNIVLTFILLVILVILFITDLFLGSVKIPFSDIISILTGGNPSSETFKTIVLDFRLPKVITALIAGVALSVSGLQMQTIFRNPLAGPYVLGISSGASLGIALVLLGFGSAPLISALGSWAMVVAAWIGAGVILFLVLMVSLRVRDILTILILGIMFGSAISAIVNILQFFSNEQMLKSYVVWTMGSLGSVTKSQLNVLIPSVVVGTILAFISAKILNALRIGEAYARTSGLNITWARILVFTGTSILAGSVTAFCGPIGFVGIAVPHITRILYRSADMYVLLIGSSIIGGIFMIVSDLISRLPGYDVVLPINSITALLGIPIVILIIIKRYRFD